MAESTFKIGDVVFLKSGSPSMTVFDVNQNYIRCIWFVDQKPTYYDFVPGVLVLDK